MLYPPIRHYLSLLLLLLLLSSVEWHAGVKCTTVLRRGVVQRGRRDDHQGTRRMRHKGIPVYGEQEEGLLAAQLLALQSLADEGVNDVGLLYVVSEETDHSGMLKANDLGLDPDYMVVGEPTGSKMMRLQKGMLKVRISCRGVACHSGYPHLGKSAIDPLVEVLHALKHHAWPSSEELGETTLNIGMVEGGQAANALAEAGEAVAMFRLIGDPEGVLNVVEAVAKGHGCSIEVISKNAPVSLEVLPGFEADVAAYNTDIAYFKLNKGQALLYGPGSIHHAHSRIEKIGVAELKEAVEAYKKIAKICLERPSA